MIAMPLLGAQKAHAQQSATATATGMITSVATTIAIMPGCKALRTSIKDLFKSKKKKQQETEDKKKAEVKAKKTANLEEAEKRGGTEVESIPVVAPITDTTLEQHGKKLDLIDSNLEDVKESTGSINKNQTCFNAIGKIVVKMLIKKLTLSIVDWINGKNSGGPLFVQNPGKFFKDIYEEELLGFSSEIGDPNKFPFGKAFIINEANKFNQHFADNAQYSLNEMIAKTNPDCGDGNGNNASCSVNFSADFSQGGWGAWDALTQVPYNNPLGFNLEASNELSKRLEGTSQSVAQNVRDSLKEAGGYLGDERCADPEGLTKEKHKAALVDGKKDAEGNIIGICKKWEYVTPGKLIGERLTDAVGYNDHALLDAETLNDAIAAIIDAAMARFTSKLIEKGLTALSENDNDETSSENIDLGEYFPEGTETHQTEMDFASFYMTDWLKNNPDFNIRTDLTQALVDEQRTYSDKLGVYNDALKDLIKWIRQLDYCIPGPNPDWETTVSNAINDIGGPNVKKRWWDTELGAQANAILDPAGIFKTIGNAVKDDDARIASARYLENLLGVYISHDQKQVQDLGGVTGVLNNLFNDYRRWINQVYFTTEGNESWYWSADHYMPGVTLEARAEFKKIVGYEQIIGNNVEEITYRKSIINRLIALKQDIDALPQTERDSLNPSSQIVTEFARLSGYFVSGDDIANIDNLYKQALDEKTYVKNDLVEGDFGCEKKMLDLWITDRAAYNKYVGREPYPFEIDHAYETVETVNSWATPATHISWSKNPTLHINEGFLYGSVYYNNWAGPWSLPPSGCESRWIHDVRLTATNSKGDPEPDLGGLRTSGDDNGMYQNVCGVVLNFERNFGVY